MATALESPIRSRRRNSAGLIRYASVFWLCEPLTDGEGARVTIGWSISLDSPLNQYAGAWGFDVRSHSALSPRTRELPFVEEVAGVLYADVSEKTRELNDRTERLIADHLLVFAHRVLFGQGTIPNIPGGVEPVDCLLIHGPRLPKLIGRLCYSHFDRKKTVSVIAPRRGFGSPPRMSTGGWPPAHVHPDPPFYDDSAVRRWESHATGNSTSAKPRIAGFDLIVATGDGFGGKLIDTKNVGQALWGTKAQAIQSLLEVDRAQLRTAIWQNFPVQLPLGMHRAVSAAVIEMMSRKGQELWKAREVEILALPPGPQRDWNAIKKFLMKDPTIPKPLESLALCAGYERFKQLPPLDQASRKVARPPVELEDIADNVKGVLKNQVGESIFDNA